MRCIGYLGLASLGLAVATAVLRGEEPADPEPANVLRSAAVPADAAGVDQAELERRFAETMSGATLIGTFTLSEKGDKKLHEEKYTIRRVKKVKDDVWLFESRIQYGTHDVTLPLMLTVKWAGDTPVITLTDLPVPGFGTFTARVLIYRNEYAGTWSGGDHGGHLFGRIVRDEDATDESLKKSETPSQ